MQENCGIKVLIYWQTKHGHEVDFIIGNQIAIEVKTTQRTNVKHLKGLKLLQEEKICQHYYLVSHDPIARAVDRIQLLPWQDFLAKLWRDELG